MIFKRLGLAACCALALVGSWLAVRPVSAQRTASDEAAIRVQAEKRAGHYGRALEQIAGLRSAVDQFFEKVMVMAENEAVRKNRLALLSELLREFTTIADFSEIGSDDK